MNRTLLVVIGILLVLILACGTLLLGIGIARAVFAAAVPGFNGVMQNWGFSFPFGFRMGPGMMGNGWRGGMMGNGWRGGMMGGGYGPGGPVTASPLSIEEAQDAVQAYLDDMGNSDLALKEVMIFDNHAYAEIVEKSTAIGAMEVLVDPASRTVYPEHGPNMMWNLKYSGMSGMMGGMMGGWRNPQNGPQPSAEMSVSAEQAVELAQKYLDQYMPGVQVEGHADPFYGYYTLHTSRGGQITGMLSVNGYSGQVFPHTWHGAFITMSEEE